ncbi:hypothetical protein K1T71_014023 [Dendrolimus kikuchii]|uniref:Uncharacterized protein n=1 Tax=Dendrolimus kikuchii TaxID=765133 RepID=A0ACC1CGP2_9NEOP|nr:hypothetical protein K1T71_014023 [Dendrolimus kikuchii]
MYRCFALLFFVSYAAASCGHRHHNYKPWNHKYHGPHHDYGRHGHQYERKFNHIAQELADTDRRALENCYESTVEQYDNDKYRLVVKLENYDVNSIVVKAKYRVVSIKAEKNGTREEYNEIRVLPSIVNIKEGGWEYLDGMLKIRFSYRSDVKGCSTVNEEEVIIPMKEEYYNIDVRIGDLETEKPKTEEKTEIPQQTIKDIFNNTPHSVLFRSV